MTIRTHAKHFRISFKINYIGISTSGQADENAGRNSNLVSFKKDLLIRKDSLRSEVWIRSLVIQKQIPINI
ncbi:MAG: hypothetical protein ISS13_01255 [Actinobacteria bacterium]|nr:hypothetical protein [Actinomycetota bacterium]MBL7060442.1 hypothetical protein [Actinomycetota bacterium]